MADQGGTGGPKIARLEKGNKARTARHASVMNEIIDGVNAIRALIVKPADKGKFIWSDANSVLDLSKLTGFPDPPPEDTWILASIDGEVQWIPTDECDCATIDGGGDA